MLAHIAISKFAYHIPFYRQSVMYARDGVEIEPGTMGHWLASVTWLLNPLVNAVRRHALGGAKVHGDDTPLPVLAPGNGRTKTGRLWLYVRDDRPSGSSDPPAVWFAYTPDRSHSPRSRTPPKRSSTRYSTDGMVGIVAERFDAGVRGGDLVAQVMIAVRIGPDFRMAVVGSPGYLASNGHPANPRDLAAHSCINLRLPTLGGLYAWEFAKRRDALHMKVHGQFIRNDTSNARGRDKGVRTCLPAVRSRRTSYRGRPACQRA